MKNLIFLLFIFVIIFSVRPLPIEKIKVIDCLKNCLYLKQQPYHICQAKCSKVGYLDTTSQSDSEDTPSSFLWDLYRKNLFNFLKRNDPNQYKGLQMMGSEFTAEWENNNEALTYFANMMTKWGSNYDPASRTFPEQYESYLMNLNLFKPTSSPADQEQLQKIQNDFFNIEDKIQLAIGNCWNSYEMVKDLAGMDYLKFERLMCPSIAGLEYNKKIIGGQFKAMESKVDGAYGDAAKALFECTQDPDHAWTDGGALKNFLANARRGQAQRFEISTKNDLKINEDRSWYKSKSSGFIFKKTKNEEKHETRLHYQHFQMSIKSQGYAAISVRPQGSWFKMSLIQKYKSTQFWRNKSLPFFGQYGTFNLMPTTIYVLYKPQVVLNVAEEDGYLFTSASSSSFSFGPFNLSSKVATMKVEKKSNNNYEVTFDVTTETPQIVAVDYAIL